MEVHFACIMWSVHIFWDAISGDPRAGTGRGEVLGVVLRREASSSARDALIPFLIGVVVLGKD